MDTSTLIEIKWNYGAWHGSAQVEPIAIFGTLIVHLSIGNSAGFSITHLTTGLAVAHFPFWIDKSVLVKAAEKLAPYLENMPDLNTPEYDKWVKVVKPKVDDMFAAVRSGEEWTDGA